jgi:uncharacterized protein (DUF2062 family)
MNARRWFHEHSLKLLAIRDTPEAIAGGVAFGIFFSLTPLFGLKTVCVLLFCWLTRSNIIAAIVAGTLHLLVFPLMPLLYVAEFRIGYWLVNHEWPKKMVTMHLTWHELFNWRIFSEVGKPWLLGSIIYGAPVGLLSYWVAKTVIVRHRRKNHS